MEKTQKIHTQKKQNSVLMEFFCVQEIRMRKAWWTRTQTSSQTAFPLSAYQAHCLSSRLLCTPAVSAPLQKALSSASCALPHRPFLHLVGPLDQADPSSNTASTMEPLSLPGQLRPLCFGFEALSQWVVIYWVTWIHTCLHIYLSNRREGQAGQLTIVPPGLPAEPSPSRCSINTFLHSATLLKWWMPARNQVSCWEKST